MANTPPWAPKPKPAPPSSEARMLQAILDAVKAQSSAIASIDTRPVVDLSGLSLPTPTVTVEPPTVTQERFDTTEMVAQLRAALGDLKVDAPDLSGLQAVLKQAIAEMPRGGGGGPRDVGIKSGGRTISPATTDNQPKVVGTWGYAAGTTGSPTIPSGARILSITATGPTSGTATATIDSGDTITIPANASLVLNPEGNLISPSLTFSGTLSYAVDWVI